MCVCVPLLALLGTLKSSKKSAIIEIARGSTTVINAHVRSHVDQWQGEDTGVIRFCRRGRKACFVFLFSDLYRARSDLLAMQKLGCSLDLFRQVSKRRTSTSPRFCRLCSLASFWHTFTRVVSGQGIRPVTSGTTRAANWLATTCGLSWMRINPSPGQRNPLNTP